MISDNFTQAQDWEHGSHIDVALLRQFLESHKAEIASLEAAGFEYDSCVTWTKRLSDTCLIMFRIEVEDRNRGWYVNVFAYDRLLIPHAARGDTVLEAIKLWKDLYVECKSKYADYLFEDVTHPGQKAARQEAARQRLQARLMPKPRKQRRACWDDNFSTAEDYWRASAAIDDVGLPGGTW